jgi:MtrB/PioB family decaheme-associated outer membrane protein
MKADRKTGLTLKLLVAAMAAAYAPAYADEVEDLAVPSSVVSVGVAGVSGDSKGRSLFGQYNGMRRDDAYLLLDIDFQKRDDATGTWLTFDGRNLGTDAREARAMWNRQGDWKIAGEYWELTRWYPRTVNTSLAGPFTAPTVSLLPQRGAGSELDLKTERKRLTVAAEKRLGTNIYVEATATNEDKDGARIFGRGFTCPSGAAPTPVCSALAAGANQWALLMLPEPINSTTRQYEAKLSFIGRQLAVTAGYYGSFYRNDNGTIAPTIVGNLNNGLGVPMGQGAGVPLTAGLRNILQLPMALPPDNEAHQFYLSGNYGITPSTRATFKLAYTHATQKDDFASNGLTGAPAGVGNYGGVVDTTLAQLGITSRPLPKLTLNANVRYEDRDDKSPLALYNIEGASRFVNGTYSLKKTAGKLEGSYMLPAGLRATLGAEYEGLDRGQFSSPECLELANDCVGDSIAGITALRAKTHERSWRAELRRSMSETVTGYIAYVHSDRDGSAWLKPAALPATGTTPLSDDAIFNRTGIFPSMFMDRKRDKVRLMADWSPMERVSVQLTVEDGKDKYSAPTEKGLSRTGMKLYGIDTSFAMSEAWKLSAYYTYSEQTLNVAHSTGYIAALKDRNSTAGLGISGTPSPKWQVGADVMYINDRNVYDQSLDAAASAANVAFLAQSGGLPDVTFRDLRLKFFGKYALSKASTLRVDVVHDRQHLNEWTWATFAYSDNTTVSLQPNQNVTFVSATWQYRFR